MKLAIASDRAAATDMLLAVVEKLYVGKYANKVLTKAKKSNSKVKKGEELSPKCLDFHVNTCFS